MLETGFYEGLQTSLFWNAYELRLPTRCLTPK